MVPGAEKITLSGTSNHNTLHRHSYPIKTHHSILLLHDGTRNTPLWPAFCMQALGSLTHWFVQHANRSLRCYTILSRRIINARTVILRSCTCARIDGQGLHDKKQGRLLGDHEHSPAQRAYPRAIRPYPVARKVKQRRLTAWLFCDDRYVAGDLSLFHAKSASKRWHPRC